MNLVNEMLPSSKVKGSLKAHLAWWEINADSFIINIIKQGFQLPFSSTPPMSLTKNNKSATDNAVFVNETLDQLITNEIIEEWITQPRVVNPLTVAQSGSNKLRLVLDLRFTNPYVIVDKIKFEDLKSASQFFTKGCMLNKFDLKSGYHHIEMHNSYKTFLGFQWCYKGKNRFFVFNVLPFGLNVAGVIFTKVLKTLLKKWRSQGFKAVLYLDDGIIISDSQEAAFENIITVRKDLKDAGFIVNEQKSQWLPSKSLIWLGFVLDSERNVISIPQHKVIAIIDIINYILNNCFISAKQLASIVGKITALHSALGRIVYLRTKQCQIWIIKQFSWNYKAFLNEESKIELTFWKNNLHTLENQSLITPIQSFTKLIYTDAGANKCGGYIHNIGATELVQSWTEEEKKRSSTWRELKAVVIFLQVHVALLKNQSI